MSPIRTARTVIGLAVTVARHPVVRAAIVAAPLLVTPKMRAMASEAALDAAFKAGALARKIARR